MISLLLIEGDLNWAQLVCATLTEEGSYSVEWVRSVAEGVERFDQGGIDAVLLDLSFPDVTEMEAFDRVTLAADNVPILVLTDATSEDVAVEAVHGGNHNYLLKSRIDGHWLPRALRHLLADKKARDSLEQTAACFAAISDGSPLGIFVSDPRGDCVYTNSAYQAIAGLTFDQALGTRWREAVHPDDREAVTTAWYEAARSRKPFRAEHRFLKRDGGVVWTRVSAAALTTGKRLLGYVQIVENITERKVVDKALSGGSEQAQSTLDSIADGIVSTDGRGDVAYINPAAQELSGWSSEDAIGKPFSQVLNLVDGITGQPGIDRMSAAVNESTTAAQFGDRVLVRTDGSESAIADSTAPIRDRAGTVTGGVMVFHDVTASRALSAQIAHAAGHDVLTDLPNRTVLDKRLMEAIVQAGPQGRRVALLFMDLDQFKDINDSLGHSMGDKLLQSVAARLIACVTAGATVCRQGGDEFAVLLPDIANAKEAIDLAAAICTALAIPHQIGRHELRVTASIGIAVYPEHGHNVESMFHHADTAMYHAKDHGRNQTQVFSREMSARTVERLVLESRLHRAIQQNEFVLHYQPKISLETGSIVGTEALIRWHHPDLGLIPPRDFIPVAEASGLIVPIGKWVLDEACTQARKWQDAEMLQSLPIAVNVSAMQFRRSPFFNDLVHALHKAGLVPHHLELELTESVLMDDVETTLGMLKALRAIEVRLAIDDFGTGYSSLSYLKQFAIDTLKIDRSFIQGITNDADDATIVSAIIRMARGLEQRVIAEGIETEEQLAFLQVHECHQGQGFYFSKPLALPDYSAFLNSWKTNPSPVGSAQLTVT